MKLVIRDKVKKDLFIAIFQSIKACTNLISILFNTQNVFIQGMDKSHVCMFEASIDKNWFNEYEKQDQDIPCISFDCAVFFSIISTKHDNHVIEIFYEGNPDTLCINLVAQKEKGEFSKFFKLPLVDFDYEIMSLPDTEYDAEFSISSKKICDITGQMISFGDDINIKCTDEQIDLITNGITGEMLVTIPIDDLTEYSINEGETVDLSYSLTYVHKMCLTSKLSNEIQFSVSHEYPLKVRYDLGELSRMDFYLAPKVI